MNSSGVLRRVFTRYIVRPQPIHSQPGNGQILVPYLRRYLNFPLYLNNENVTTIYELLLCAFVRTLSVFYPCEYEILDGELYRDERPGIEFRRPGNGEPVRSFRLTRPSWRGGCAVACRVRMISVRQIPSFVKSSTSSLPTLPCTSRHRCPVATLLPYLRLHLLSVQGSHQINE